METLREVKSGGTGCRDGWREAIRKAGLRCGAVRCVGGGGRCDAQDGSGSSILASQCRHMHAGACRGGLENCSIRCRIRTMHT
jgi:hypothetical protein